MPRRKPSSQSEQPVFNPMSIDAQLSSMHTTMKAQDEKLDKILVQTEKTNGRVTKLEGQVSYAKGKIVGASIGISLLGAAVGNLLLRLVH